ncbi:MAG: 2-amino-4-hydroxy-6-hydroxymethyldihydropteridine diphosphokinase [Rikenellaceae bacterium]|nr:2-amino-4-hydroxy-6-hydroxymethyldihydropteridine diphosphokinase [Rikenellaceae bacterium]
MARVVLVTGGNLGDMRPRLQTAQKLINDRIGAVMRCSHRYTSDAWGFDSADEFTNQVLVVDTDLAPEAVLFEVQKIERELGRDRRAEQAAKEASGARYCSRVIDIDILFYDNLVIDTPDLVIPHPLMQERDFVLRPLYELMKEFRHPVLGKTIGELRAELAEAEGRTR